MHFYRHRLLIKIVIIILWIGVFASLLAGTIAGIAISVVTKSFLPFLISFVAGHIGALVLFLLIKLTKWLLRDFIELDDDIQKLKDKIKLIEKPNNSIIKNTTTAIINSKPNVTHASELIESERTEIKKEDSVPLQKCFFKQGDIVKSVVQINEKIPQNCVGKVLKVEEQTNKVVVLFRVSVGNDIIKTVSPNQITN